MNLSGFSAVKKLCFVVTAATILTVNAQGAFALTTGCSSTAAAAADAKAQAMVAVDKAAADQIQKQPASVLNTTCFNEAAGVSASAGGNIFSGDFSSQLMPVIDTALQTFSDDFEGSIVDFFTDTISGLVGGDLGSIVSGSLGGLLSSALPSGLGSLFGTGASTVATSYSCDGIKTIQDAISSEGITSGVKLPSISELLNGTVPSGAGEKFKKSFEASAGKNVFSQFKTAMDALPKPAAPDFSSAVSLCDTLSIAGITGSCP